MNLQTMAAVALMSSMVLMRLRLSVAMAFHRVNGRADRTAENRARSYAGELLRSLDFDRSRYRAVNETSQLLKETSK